MKNNYKSVFDIIGPVMIGPSSSHTAGRSRLAESQISFLARFHLKQPFTIMGLLPRRIVVMAQTMQLRRAC